MCLRGHADPRYKPRIGHRHRPSSERPPPGDVYANAGAMSVQPLSLIPAQAVPSATAVLYTSPVGVISRIDSLSVCNVGAVPAQVTINLVPSGAAAGSGNVTTSGQTILPGQTWNSPNEIGKVLGAGDAIAVLSSVANALTIAAGGLQVTAS
ncbi:hypothetical protein GDI3683 [Gluconacetobacter diazotrophicus PA1 5]|uniref:Uncharacterized protein n=2 Tax=Gluconacetobacter diazotrophicus TaxID=33996 RepID=A9H7D8_GLUDA|nr:hypothetical protein GDI3683 [Gluconacetobacter diazotrophicus PA1 5]